MLVDKLIEIALENGFEECSRYSTAEEVKYKTYRLDTGFWVPGEHSYDRVRIYLLVNENEKTAFLCYSPSITYWIPSTNEDFHEWLDEAAEFATFVSGTSVFSWHGLYGEFENNPLTAFISSYEQVSDLGWFIRATTAYQAVIHAMTEDCYNKETK